MKTVTKQTRAIYSDKGSKFIGLLLPVQSTDDFDEKLAQVQNEYHDATHHCYGWRIDPNEIREFAQDDGEPSGTAGRPILNQLKSFEAVNAACIVIRYYGGTNLGKPGLIKAYGGCAERCLQKAKLKQIVQTQNFNITYPYSAQSKINQLENRFDLKEIKANYLEEVTMEIACRLGEAPNFLDNVYRMEHLGVEVECSVKVSWCLMGNTPLVGSTQSD